MTKFKSSTGEEYDPNEIRALTLGGGTIRHGDEMFEQELDDWERQGVATDLVYMARPLMDGTPKQQQAAEEFLTSAVGQTGAKKSAAMQIKLLGLLKQAGLAAGCPPTDSDEDFTKGWDEHHGDKHPSYEGHVLDGRRASRPEAD